MPKYAKPTVTKRKRRGRPRKYNMDLYAEVLRMRLKGVSLGKIAAEKQIPKSSVWRMLDSMGFSSPPD